MTPNTTITIKIPNEAAKTRILQAYKKYEKPTAIPYVETLFILPNCRITLYTSGKLLFQGLDAANEAARWEAPTDNIQSSSRNAITATTHALLSQYVGCDETGVGDYFGPLVACAAYVDDAILAKIAHLNIVDSKQLTDEYIVRIAPELRTLVPHAIIKLSNAQYNQFIANGFNGNLAKVFVHQQAITKLFASTNLQPLTPIVMDAFSTADLYHRYLDKLAMPQISQYIPTIFEQKAENKYLGVAVASIIGRAYFLQTMDEQNKTYHTQFPLGAGKHVDTFGQKFVAEYSEDILHDLVKWHFANTSRII